MKYYDKLIFELSREGRTGYSLGSSSFAVDGVVPEAGIPAGLRRGDAPALPQVSEIDVVRHYRKRLPDRAFPGAVLPPRGRWMRCASSPGRLGSLAQPQRRGTSP